MAKSASITGRQRSGDDKGTGILMVGSKGHLFLFFIFN